MRVIAAVALACAAIALAGHKSAASPARLILAPAAALVKARLERPSAPSQPAVPLRLRAMAWAVHEVGRSYCWGGTGPCFDCSGLIYSAYVHAGVRGMPRDTYEMLSSPMLRRVSGDGIKRGDLAFFGTGHVELVAYARDGVIQYTYGARDYGTVVQFYRVSGWFMPTAVYEVR